MPGRIDDLRLRFGRGLGPLISVRALSSKQGSLQLYHACPRLGRFERVHHMDQLERMDSLLTVVPRFLDLLQKTAHLGDRRRAASRAPGEESPENRGVAPPEIRIRPTRNRMPAAGTGRSVPAWRQTFARKAQKIRPPQPCEQQLCNEKSATRDVMDRFARPATIV